MDLILIVCGWLVFGVFALAGFSKLQDASAVAQSLVDFGVPQAASRQVARWLPWLELALATALLLPRLAWLAAAVAVLLLGCFTVAVSVALLRGQRPSCNCFGQVRSRPISTATAVRDLLFTACAAVLVWAGADALAPGLLAITVLGLGQAQASNLVMAVLGVLVAIQFWLLLHLTRQHGRVLLKIDNLELKLQGLGVPATGQLLSGQVPPRGSAAPVFVAPTLSGRQISLQSQLAERKPLLLLFVSADCAPCRDLIAELPAWLQRAGRDKLLVISSGSIDANRGKFNDLQADQVLLQTGFEVNALYGVIATPSALRLNADGHIDSDLAIGSDAIKQLLGVSADPQPVANLHGLTPATGRR